MNTGVGCAIRYATYCKAQREVLAGFYVKNSILSGVRVNECLQRFRAEVEELLALILLLLLCEAIFRLGHLELSLALKVDEADTQVRSTEVYSEIVSLLFPGRPTKYEGRNHWLSWQN